MHKLKSLALLALAGLGLSASGAETTNGWWNVYFEPTNGVEFVEGSLIGFTNKTSTVDDTQQPWAEGFWTVLDGDESYLTNGFNTAGAFGTDWCLKLDTQGKDLTWSNQVEVAANLKALVDADLYLVGSDSEPTEFDDNQDVQTAIYLKNLVDEDPDSATYGETTNSILCVYAYDDTAEGGKGANYWQQLDGVDIQDNSWVHIQVLVDYVSGDLPVVKVYVNGTEMHALGDANSTEWTVANSDHSEAVGKVSSVSFRGTGAVDNFVGQLINVEEEQAFFKAILYLDGEIMDEMVTDEILTIDNRTTANYTGLEWESYDDENHCPVFGLSKVEIVDFVNNGVRTYSFEYDPDDPDEVYISPTPTEGEVRFGFSGKDLDGLFSVYAPTIGAQGSTTAPETVTNICARIYFKSAYAKEAYVTTTLDGTVSTNSTILKPVDAGGIYPTNLVWTFDAVKGGNILTNIVLSNGATLYGYANGKATVKAEVANELAADTLYAAASYVAGALVDGQDLRPTTNGSEIVFAPYTPPVAIIVADNVTHEYSSLRAAVEEAAQLADPVTIQLVRDDNVSFTAEAPILDIDFEVTIDGGSNTLYGMTGYAAGYHEIRVGGNSNVTIKDLKLTEFGDTATRSSYVMPLVTRSFYKGTLTLDGVQINKFNRQALCLFGGKFEITNCNITGYYDPEMGGNDCFQSAIEVFNAKGTVAETIVTGVGSTLTNEDSKIASCFTLNSDWSQTPWVGGTGSITILSGSYTGEYVVLGMTNAAQTVDIQGGTFIATAPAADSAFGLDDQSTGDSSKASITISGGWFDRAPEVDYLAKGCEVVEDVAGAPVDGAYNHVILGNAIWIGGASGDWNNPDNWDIGSVPTTTTVVTFTNDAQVGISPTVCKCKEMVLTNANVTIGRADQGTGADLNFYKNAGSAVSGTGTLTLNTVGLFNQNNSGVLTIGTDLGIQGNVTFKGVKDGNQHAGSWTVTGKTTIADGVTVKSIDDAITTFQGDIDIGAGSQVTFFAAFGANETYHGGEIVASKVTLAHNEGSPATTLLLQTRNKGKITINDSQIVTDSTDYYVKKSSQEFKEGNATIYQTTYEVLQKRTVTVTADEGLTVEGVTTGLFVPGTNFVITVTGFDASTEQPSVMITNGTSVLLTTNAATFTYTAPDSDIGVVATKEAKTVEPPQVDAGQDLDQYNADHANDPGFTPVKPIDFSDAAMPLCKISFVAPEAGWYFLYTNATVNGTYAIDLGSKREATADSLVTLTESAAETAKFFKIGWSETEPTAE